MGILVTAQHPYQEDISLVGTYFMYVRFYAALRTYIK